MNGIHDMGGMDGFGPVEVEQDEPVFHQRWEARVFGINLLFTGNIDAGRHSIERIPPAEYLGLPYYGRWLRALETRLAELRVLGKGELDARIAGRPFPSSPHPARPPPGNPDARREVERAPAFRVGQRVRARNWQPPGHTRLPAYARGRCGVRIISTTDIDLASAVEEDRFREALYYRLNVVGIVAPPLRERGTDVQLLADHFLDVFTTPASRRRVVGFSAEARLAMQQWNWPGNVRELVNRVKNAIVMCEKGPLSSGDLDLGNRVRGRAAMTLDEAREAAELSALLAALAAADGDLGRAAVRLGTSRAALCRLMHKHRIEVASPQLVVDTVR